MHLLLPACLTAVVLVLTIEAVFATNLEKTMVSEPVLTGRLNMRRASKPMIVSIAWYKRDEYPQLLSSFSDRRLLPTAYDEWLEDARRAERLARDAGYPFARIYIRPTDFRTWCTARGSKPDAAARNQFAMERAIALYDA